MATSDKRSWWKCIASCIIMVVWWTVACRYMMTHDATWWAFIIELVSLYVVVTGICYWNGVPKNCMKTNNKKSAD